MNNNKNAFTVHLQISRHALLNYKEIIRYYKQPFYMRWFSNAPSKELMEL